MQFLQAIQLSREPHLLHSFIRDSSRSLSAHPIQPLPPEFVEATPLAASRKAGKTARFWKARETLGRWIRSPPNPRGSDLGEPNDHSQATPSRAKASRIPPAGLPTRLRPRAVQLPGRPRPANSSPGGPRRSRGTPHAQEDGPEALRRKPGPARAAQRAPGPNFRSLRRLRKSEECCPPAQS